ncbi:MAG: hypothetical protein JWP75_712 [Frondihabitans sp.]|nr:hypothetical protein [Frondihabitans sp.]
MGRRGWGMQQSPTSVRARPDPRESCNDDMVAPRPGQPLALRSPHLVADRGDENARLAEHEARANHTEPRHRSQRNPQQPPPRFGVSEAAVASDNSAVIDLGTKRFYSDGITLKLAGISQAHSFFVDKWTELRSVATEPRRLPCNQSNPLDNREPPLPQGSSHWQHFVRFARYISRFIEVDRVTEQRVLALQSPK